MIHMIPSPLKVAGRTPCIFMLFYFQKTFKPPPPKYLMLMWADELFYCNLKYYRNFSSYHLISCLFGK